MRLRTLSKRRIYSGLVWGIASGVIILVFIFGAGPKAFYPPFNDSHLIFYNGQYVQAIGRVCAEPENRIDNLRLTICISNLKIGSDENFRKVEGRVLVTNALYPKYTYGEVLLLKGRLQTPKSFEDFDYPAYLGLSRIYSLMYYPKISRLVGQEVSLKIRVYKSLLNFKHNLKIIIDRSLPEPEAGLAAALILGYKQDIFPPEKTAFARAGLSHIVAISGAHVAILSALIVELALSLGFNKVWTQRSLLLFLVFYPVMTGLSSSAVRASVMAGLAVFAATDKDGSRLGTMLMLAAAIMLIFNPRLLRNDIGFQLSFMAVLGLIYIEPMISGAINKKFKIFKKKGLLRASLEVLSVSLSVQLAVWPILALNFKQISLIAPLSNLVVLWALPPLLSALPPALLLSSIMPGLRIIWFMPSYFLLRFIVLAARILSYPEWSAKPVAGLSLTAVVVYYIFLTTVFAYLYYKRKQKQLPVRGAV